MIKELVKEMIETANVQFEEKNNCFVIDVEEGQEMQVEEVISWARLHCYHIDEGFAGLFYDYADAKEMFAIEIYLTK